MKVLVPATTANLGPGFDLLGASLDVENQLEAYFSDEYSLVEEGYSDGKPYTENLIFKIMVEFFNSFGEKRAFALKTTNEIPFQRGMGSSSAAIVGALFLANEMINRPLDINALVEKAIEIEGHPDNVAPALLGGVIFSTSDKEYLRLPPPNVSAYLLVPDFKIETRAARAVLPNEVKRELATRNSSKLAKLVLSLEREDGQLFLSSLDDEIHEPYRGKLIPGFHKLRAKAIEFGGRIIISGSGPTLIYLKEPDENNTACSDATLLSESWELDNKVLAVKLGSNRVRLED